MDPNSGVNEESSAQMATANAAAASNGHSAGASNGSGSPFASRLKSNARRWERLVG